MVHADSGDGTLYKIPLGSDGDQLDGLMTLRNYVGGGHEVEDTKVLVCVKSIGTRKTSIDIDFHKAQDILLTCCSRIKERSSLGCRQCLRLRRYL